MSFSPSSQFFFPRVLPQWLVSLRSVDQLHLAFPVIRFPVREHPDIGGDAGVVEHVERQSDDRLQPVVFDDPTTDVALPLAGIAGEKGTAVMDLGDPAAEGRVLLHLGELVGEKQHLTVAGPRDQGIFGIARMIDQETRVAHILLATHACQVTFPALAVGWIGKHEVELVGRKSVVGERRVLRSAHDVVGRRAFTFQQQVGLADGVGFGVDLLAIKMCGNLLATLGRELRQCFLGHCQHAAGPAGAVVEQISSRL